MAASSIHHQSFNIILVGSTGHGKSTFCNYLHDFRTKKLFKEGDFNPESCTRDWQHEEMLIDDTLYSINDTPGLNDTQEFLELTNLQSVVEGLMKLGAAHLIVLVIPQNFKRSKGLVRTLGFYCQLFQDFFQHGQFYTVMTQMNPGNYAELVKSEKYGEVRQRYIAELKSLIGFEPPFFDFVDSYSEQLADLGAYSDKPPTSSLTARSQITREKLLTFATKCKAWSVVNPSVPLPPNLLEKKHILIQNLKSRNEELISVSRSFNAAIAELLILIKTQEEQQNEKEIQLGLKERLVTELRAPIASQVQTYSGDTIINLFNHGTYTISAEPPFEVHTVEWNCVLQINERTDTKVTYTVQPNFIAISQRTGGQYWFLQVWLESNGEVLNATRISTTLTECDMLRHEIRNIRGQISLYTRTTKDKQKELQSVRDKQSDIQRRIRLLTPDKCAVNELKPIFKMITKHYQSLPD